MAQTMAGVVRAFWEGRKKPHVFLWRGVWFIIDKEKIFGSATSVRSLIRMFAAASLLLISGCASFRRAIIDVPVIDCGPAQTRYCEAPSYVAGNSLLETEPEDAVNRSKWLVCVTDHRTLVDCLHALQSAGVIKGKEK